MADPLAEWWVHPVTVRRLTGSGAYGDTYATPTTVTGFVDDRRRLVRAADGSETVAETTVLLPKGTPTVPLGSEVDLPATFGGRTTTVIATSVHDAAGKPGIPEHLELNLA